MAGIPAPMSEDEIFENAMRLGLVSEDDTFSIRGAIEEGDDDLLDMWREKVSAAISGESEGPHSHEQAARTAMNAFHKLDLNKDGYVDKDELTTVLKGCTGWSKADMERMMHEADMDKDGKIELKEFLVWVFQSGGNQATLRKALDIKPKQVSTNGIVVWVDSRRTKETLLRPVIEEVSQEREVHFYENADDAKDELEKSTDGSVVCVVSSRTASIELSTFLRSPERAVRVRAVPLLVLTRDPKTIPKASAHGTAVETDVNKLAKRILSLPSKDAVLSEDYCAIFEGQSTDLRFGHFKDAEKPYDFSFTKNEATLLRACSRQRLTWYPEVSNYNEHIGKLESYMMGMQPVHRCKSGTFLAILREGGLMSREHLEEVLDEEKSDKATIMRTARHMALLELAKQRRFVDKKRYIFKYAEARCALSLKEAADIVDDDEVAVAKAKVESTRVRGLPAADSAEVDRVVDVVVNDVISLKGGAIGGLHYSKDGILGTTRHVFATMGPNSGHWYGTVVIMLKRDLLYHPGTWLSPLAATGFVGPRWWGFKHRPWGGEALLEVAKGDSDPLDDDDDKKEVPEGTEEENKSDDFDYSDPVPDTPEKDTEGVEACVHSAINMAATARWALIMAKEVDAMSRYLIWKHRDGYDYDIPYNTDDKIKDAQEKIMNGDVFREDAFRQVIDYYQEKNSHTLYECHLPGFVPIGAIEKIYISDKLYTEHTEIKSKVETFVMPDGRTLKELVEITPTLKDCMDAQHAHFEEKRSEYETCPVPPRPTSLFVAGRNGRPCFFPRDLPLWFGGNGTEMRISFACRAAHDIRVFFAQTAEAQREDADLEDAKWKSSLYQICLGSSFNSESFITKGIRKTRHAVHIKDDPIIRCRTNGAGETAQKVWERYWFRYKLEGETAHISCGFGPMGENQIMEWQDTKPIKEMKYVGVSCWGEPTAYCDIGIK